MQGKDSPTLILTQVNNSHSGWGSIIMERVFQRLCPPCTLGEQRFSFSHPEVYLYPLSHCSTKSFGAEHWIAVEEMSEHFKGWGEVLSAQPLLRSIFKLFIFVRSRLIENVQYGGSFAFLIPMWSWNTFFLLLHHDNIQNKNKNNKDISSKWHFWGERRKESSVVQTTSRIYDGYIFGSNDTQSIILKT